MSDIPRCIFDIPEKKQTSEFKICHKLNISETFRTQQLKLGERANYQVLVSLLAVFLLLDLRLRRSRSNPSQGHQVTPEAGLETRSRSGSNGQRGDRDLDADLGQHDLEDRVIFGGVTAGNAADAPLLQEPEH